MYSLTNTELLQGWCEIYWPVCFVQWVIRKYHRNDPNNKHMFILLIFNSFFFLIWIMFHILYNIAETFLASGWISWKKLRTSLPLLKGTYSICALFLLCWACIQETAVEKGDSGGRKRVIRISCQKLCYVHH